jgi:hypothetical protein
MLRTEQSARSRRLVQLMVAAQAGDKEAFRTLVYEIGAGLTNFVRARILDRGEIEDVCQEILIQVYESRQLIRSARSSLGCSQSLVMSSLITVAGICSVRLISS